jgi:RHS repeat-associated protein
MRHHPFILLAAVVAASVALTGCNFFGDAQDEEFSKEKMDMFTASLGEHPQKDGTPPRTKGVTVSDPIGVSDGGLFTEPPADLDLGGPLHLRLKRFYDSSICCNSVASALGDKWMHNFDARLRLPSPPPPGVPSNLPSTLFVTLFHADSISFQKTGISCCQLQFPTNRPYQLIATSSGYQFMDPQENSIYTFDSSGNLLSIADRNGNAITVTRTAGAPGPSQVNDGLGRTLTFTYTGSNLTKVTDQVGRGVTYEYSGGMLSAFTDANGKRTQYTYTSAGSNTGLMSVATRPMANKPATQTFDSQGRVATQTDSLGNKLSLTYNSSANTTTVSEPLGVTSTYLFGSEQTLAKLTDSSGASSQYTYDPASRPVAATDKLGNRTSATYDPTSGLPATNTDELGNATTYTYGSTSQAGFTFYDRTVTRYPDGSSLSLVRDSKGNVTSLTDRAGQKWQATRNSRGQIATLTLPTAGLMTFSYANDGNLASVQLDSGDTYKLTYDTSGRPSTVALPDGNTLQLQYDGVGNVLKIVDAAGNATGFAYDANNNGTGLTDALGAILARSYDSNDLTVSATDALGKVTKIARDALTRVQSIANAVGNSVTFAYDNLNRATSAVDASGKGFQYGWDKENRLVSVTDGLGRAAQLKRDARGGVTQISGSGSETFQLALNQSGRLTSRTNALTQAMQMTYDGRGLLQSTTLPLGISASLKRDPLGNITQLTDPNGNNWLQSFDRMGRLVSSTDPLGQARTYTYDSRQRMASVTFPLGAARYNYDAAGNLVSRLYSDSTELDYTYDAARRLTGGTGIVLARDAAGRVVQSNGLAIARDDAGRIASVTYAPGKTVTYTYDQRGLLTTVADWMGGSTAFVYDDARELASMSLPNGVREDYTYDADGRVASIQASLNGTVLASVALHRDAAGRIISADRSAPQIPDVAGSTTQQVDAAHQSSLASYDSMGRVISDVAQQYTWDLASRLSSYTSATGTVAFTYDSMGQRLSRSAGADSVNYVWNYATGLPTVAAVQSGGADQRYYIWLPDGSLLAGVDAASGARQFFHFDETGSTMFLSDDNGSVTDTYAMTPYGESVLQTGTTDNPFTFQGRYGVMQESGTAFYFMRARYYDGATMRFLSRDTRLSTGPREMNPYGFAMGNPLRFHDATGAAPVENGPVTMTADLMRWPTFNRLMPQGGKGTPSSTMPAGAPNPDVIPVNGDSSRPAAPQGTPAPEDIAVLTLTAQVIWVTDLYRGYGGWVFAGFTGSFDEFLNDVLGPPGPPALAVADLSFDTSGAPPSDVIPIAGDSAPPVDEVM